jgi:predicted AAA+ superfamily ATPase
VDDPLWIDLLDPVEEDAFLRDPRELDRRAGSLPPGRRWVVIDEIQKAPRLLDVVHKLIEGKKVLFALTGSSARKLKRGASNLLAGRAFVHHLHPLTSGELGARFALDDALAWGTLPEIFTLATVHEKARYLRAYALTYLKEEVAAEQFLRRLAPFRQFLEVAAQMNGQVLNYKKIAGQVGVDSKTVMSYFTLLEDTLVGFHLPAYHRSLRKQHLSHPKFYLFDPGVKRALEMSLDQTLNPRTFGYGAAFEHFVILELTRLNDYFEKDFVFSYVKTYDGREADLVVRRPGKPEAFVEIKSTERVGEKDVASLVDFSEEIPGAEYFCFSRDPHPKKIGPVHCLPWTDAARSLGLSC